jgi:hypothetical protein
MDPTVSTQIELARTLGARIQFVLEPDDGALSTLHSYSELCAALVKNAKSGYVQVYDAENPRRLVTQPMASGNGDTLRVEQVTSAVDRALAQFKARSTA